MDEFLEAVERHPLAGKAYHRVVPWLFRTRRQSVRLDNVSAKFVVTTPIEHERVNTLAGESDLLRTVLSAIRPRDIVYDVGANVGTHTCLFADRVGDDGLVVAVEPDAANIAERGAERFVRLYRE